MKMPEPVATIEAITFGPRRHYQHQVIAKIPDGMHNLYDKQALIDLLEAAAVECDQERVAHVMFKNYQAAMALADVADAIRSMKEKL